MENHKLDDRTELFVCKRPKFIFKDHKDNFYGYPNVRLIWSKKSSFYKLKKAILDKCISVPNENIRLQLWFNTYYVINWINRIKYKGRNKFIQ